MHGLDRISRAARIIAVSVGLLAAVVGPATVPGPAGAASLTAWNGGINLYRSGVFTTQKTWQWCTAADVQIMRNIVDRDDDHSRANQQRYYSAMRAHNRYDVPAGDGVDPAGWTWGLRHYVDPRYRLVSSGSFNSALRSAVTSLRRTNLPVGITVGRGSHAWVLTGFTATADPAKTTRFSVTSVRVTGPLWGLQSRSYGYDMRPNTRLTPKQLAGFFTPWHYARIRMAWEGRWVSIQPIGTLPVASATPKPTVRPTPTPTPTPTPSPTPRPSPTPTPTPTPTPAIELSASPPAASPPPDGAAAAANASPGPTIPPAQPTSAGGPTGDPETVAWLALGAVAVMVVIRALWGPRQRRRPT